MKATLIALVALAALPSALQAQDTARAGETLRVFARAVPACVVSEAQATGAINATFAADGTGGGTISIVELVDPATAQPRASSVQLSLPVLCNSAHRLVVATGGGLLREGGQRGNSLAEGGFADLMPYSIGLDWGATSLDGTSAGSALSSVQQARAGDLLLDISTLAGGGFLTSGRYQDTITIRFEPAD